MYLLYYIQPVSKKSEANLNIWNRYQIVSDRTIGIIIVLRNCKLLLSRSFRVQDGLIGQAFHYNKKNLEVANTRLQGITKTIIKR